MRKSSCILIKILKLHNSVWGIIQYLFVINNRHLPKPPESIIEIGFFDHKLLIQVKDEFKMHFLMSDINEFQNSKPYKSDSIRLVLYEGEVLVKKAFKGSLKHKIKFFNEVECLYRLRNLNNTPKLYFIDVRGLIIYITYIKGECLTRMMYATPSKNPAPTFRLIKESCMTVLEMIHNQHIIVNDIQAQNIIFNESSKQVFFIDFADAIYYNPIFSKNLNYAKRMDVKYLTDRVLSKLP